jgi:hypothetical protein
MAVRGRLANQPDVSAAWLQKAAPWHERVGLTGAFFVWPNRDWGILESWESSIVVVGKDGIGDLELPAINKYPLNGQ